LDKGEDVTGASIRGAGGVIMSGTPTAGAITYWTGAGTVAHASFGTADVVLTSGAQTIAGAKTFTSNVLMGGTAARAPDALTVTKDGAFASVNVEAYRTSAGGIRTSFQGFAAGGSYASPATLTNGQLIFRLGGNAWDGSAFGGVARVEMAADGAHSAGSTPGKMFFMVTPSGSTTPVEAVTVMSDGDVGIGTTAPQGKVHSYDGTGGNVRTSTSGIVGTEIDVLAAATVAKVITVRVVGWGSGGSTDVGSITIAKPGAGSTASATAGGFLTFRLYSTGRLTVVRGSGAETWAMSADIIYM
jgi:hypothetical protein